MNKQSPNYNPKEVFACFTPFRRNGLRKAILNASDFYLLTLAESSDLRQYIKADSRRRADWLRLCLYLHIHAIFANKDSTNFRKDFGGFVLELDGTHALHFKNITERLPYIPKWVNPSIVSVPSPQLTEFIEQASLFPDVVENEKIRLYAPPLDSLYPILAAYDVDEIDGTITNFFLRDQNGSYIRHEEEIDLSREAIPLETTEEVKKGRIRISKKA